MSACQGCGQTTVRPGRPIEDALTRHRFELVACAACGTARTAPEPADLGPYYPAEYYGGRHGFTHEFCLKRRLRWAWQDGAPARLIDVGCGDGSFLERAKERGSAVRGVEFSPDAARARGLTVVRELAEISPADPADRITFWHSLEHFRDPLGALVQARERLAPDGRVIVAVPYATSLQARLTGAAWLHFDVPRHLHHWSERGLRSLMERAGLRVVRIRRQEFEYDLLGWSQSLCTALFGPPREFMNALMGRARGSSRLRAFAEIALGLGFTAALAPVAILEGLVNRGATLVITAERVPRSGEHG